MTIEIHNDGKDYWLQTWADSRPLGKHTVRSVEEGLRVYKHSPDRITVQVRTATTNQARISGAHLDKAQVQELIAALQHLETLL